MALCCVKNGAPPPPIALLFSTKSAYRFVENLNMSIERPEGCHAVHLNMVFRHGTRYPSTNDVKRINAMLSKVQETMNKNEEVKLQVERKLGLQLEFPFDASTDKLLTKVGDEELYKLGQRFQNRFPELFQKSFSVNELKFTSTCKERSSRSAHAFQIGFLEGHGTLGKCKIQPAPIQIMPCENDEILRYFDLCEKYQKHVENNDASSKEMNKFLEGLEVTNVVRKVKKRLKLEKDHTLTSNHILSMYLYCAYSIGILNQSINNGWCQLFDENDLNVMEYVLDLKAFYKRSAAFKITYESSCPLLRDILHSIQAKARRKVNHKSLKGIFRSSHAETLIPLYALMGLHLDKEHLKANNFNEMEQRQFRGSSLAPFTGNLAFVLYECQQNEYKIQFYSNERLIKIPCCKSKVDCPFEMFESCYQKISDNCDLNEMCKTVNETVRHKEL